MRLTKQQTEIIMQTVTRLASMGAVVYLFGSRLNDQAKGGDIDLFIESDTNLSLIQRAQIKMQLESQLGLPVDIVSKSRGAVATPFQVIAQSQSTQLEI
ncbi:MAG: nucleotidyltransferase domain-containing protein [Methylicorpusculum sp.]|uniref:nucleotidyltransferase family protein n=1 Tax=Methylicorpusculum sp. TaxID=2713644 RepID=UPI002728255D|nr:nucleotidyltransferase domain-containing protein [Methylicorpusculum sp.]MDO8940093.1 nucleotidyltransferase domain-containing protein [Methylicorpusculum sp.]MDP2202519.1 nucleotidyltransferase domain-containing protein [Methylicorpusculum sp.]